MNYEQVMRKERKTTSFSMLKFDDAKNASSFSQRISTMKINSLFNYKAKMSHNMKTLPVLFVLFTASIMILSSIAPSYADIIPPKHQMKIGISYDDIICDERLFKIFKEGTNDVACVQPNSVAKLVSHGWAKAVDEKQLSDAINRKSIELGKITILEKIPIKIDIGRLASDTPVSGYDVVFEVCASSTIQAPDILVRSDSESKRFELVEIIDKDSCVISASKIKAANEDTINITLLNKGDISKKIQTLQAELDSLKKQLSDVKQTLKDASSSDTQKQGTKIVELRKQVNDKREELNRILFVIHATQTEKQKLDKLTFSGKVIEGESASILSILDATQTPGLYDVVFETCAGKTTIRLPVVTINSDIQSTDVKLGDKILANSCQMSSSKIEANDKESINIAPAGNEVSSTKAANLEMLIGSMQSELVQEKQRLKSLIHNPDRPENFDELLNSHVTKIIELRNQIANAKAEFSKILYLTYK